MQTTSSYLCVCLLGHKQTTSTGWNCLNMSHSINDEPASGLLVAFYSSLQSLSLHAYLPILSDWTSQQSSVSVRNRQASRIMQWLYVAPPLGWLFYNNLQLNCLHLTTDKCHCPFSLFTTKRSTRWTTMKTRAYRKSRGRFWRGCLHKKLNATFPYATTTWQIDNVHSQPTETCQ